MRGASGRKTGDHGPLGWLVGWGGRFRDGSVLPRVPRVACLRRHVQSSVQSKVMTWTWHGISRFTMLEPSLHARGGCAQIPYSRGALGTFEAFDATFTGSKFDIAQVSALDGSACQPVTRDGTAMGMGGQCIDFGVPKSRGKLTPMTRLDQSTSFPFEFLPRPGGIDPSPMMASTSAKLQRLLEKQQFLANSGCGLPDAPAWRAMYYVHLVPQLGFGSVIEYAMMFLARATHMRSQLALGRTSSPVWTSEWACGAERSLSCYFNVTSCCGAHTLDGRPLELPRRRNPLNIGLSPFDTYGKMWLSGQLAHFFFSRLTPMTRRAIDERRANVWPRASSVAANGGLRQCIGMHIRGGDSCHARRFCPNNLTSTFFAEAERLRAAYGVNTVVLATDSAKAAQLCASRPLGFECRTMRMAREKFESSTYIENRVSSHASGELSGSTVALDALADVDMLADCDYHVLVLRSAISRLAYALSLARHGRPTPLISMQWAYSPAFMKSAFKGKGALKRKVKSPKGGLDKGARGSMRAWGRAGSLP